VEQWEQLKQNRNLDPNIEFYDFNLKRNPEETRKVFYRRQENAIKDFVENNLWFIKRGEKQTIKLIKKHLKVLADLFFARKDKKGNTVQAIIVWANRGGGKSLIAAVLIFICMVWRKLSFSDLAGSQEQALEIYSYITAFWECLPSLKERLLDGEPLMHRTNLKNGVNLKVIPNSQNATRGKHPEGFVADEVCQKERYKDDNILQATNSVITQEDFVILYLSTFHLPVGHFADTWDQAEALDFVRVKWNIFFCFAKCERDIDCKKCVFTRKKIKKDSEGNIIKVRYFGCDGIARKTDGWLSFEQALKIKKKAEIKGQNWKVEFECCRPETQSKVYNTKKLRRSLVDRVIIPNLQDTKRSVGIDFGTSKQCAITLAIKGSNALIVPFSDFSVGRDLDYIVSTLKAIRIRFGDFLVYGDSEQSYGIMYLRKSGFTVESVAFNKYKETGIQNLERYINSSRLRILNVRSNRILYRQLVNYKKDEFGKPIKAEDHGPDSLMLAALRFDFFIHFGREIARAAADAQLKQQAEDNDAEVMVF